MYKVFIGVGHGGKDPGATGNGLKEKDLNLSIALSCRDVLLRHGMSVKMSRTTDENDTLSDETKECNEYNPDYAIDIHNNAGGGNGAEVFYHFKGGFGKEVAEDVLSEIVKLGQNSRGTKTRIGSDGKDYYGFIRNTVCPSNIVECAFIDNAEDIKIIDEAHEQKAMGEAIAKGILKAFGIKYIEEGHTMQDFKDVSENHWAYMAIKELSDKGIINGYPDGTFKPDKPITRAEVCSIISSILED